MHTRIRTAPHLVSDFIDATETTSPRSHRSMPRVGFYPRKGGVLAHRILDRATESEQLHRVPLEGYARDELQSVIATLDVYLDPGHHPGRDRLPREAALQGAVTLTSRRGAAAYWGDVPLNDEFKWSPGEHEVEAAARVLVRTLRDLDAAREAQEPYRRWVREAPQRFRSEVSNALQSSMPWADASDERS